MKTFFKVLGVFVVGMFVVSVLVVREAHIRHWPSASATRMAPMPTTAAVAANDEALPRLCILTVRVSGETGLGGYTDLQISNGLCLAVKATVQTIATRSALQPVCQHAARAMMVEFKRRFPGDDPEKLAGKC